MSNLVRCSAVVLLSLLVAAPAIAGSGKHPRHDHRDRPYTHNYGPPVWPGQAYAYYDGPLRALCKQGAAAYRGQNGKRYPCN